MEPGLGSSAATGVLDTYELAIKRQRSSMSSGACGTEDLHRPPQKRARVTSIEPSSPVAANDGAARLSRSAGLEIQTAAASEVQTAAAPATTDDLHLEGSKFSWMAILDRAASASPEAVARALRVQVGRLPLEKAVEVLAAATRVTARMPQPAAQQALQQVCSHAALRLARSLTPLHTCLSTPTQREAWCTAPLEAVEAVLGHQELGVDVEETVLEAAIMWLDRNLVSLGEEADQRLVAARVLGRVKWGLLLPYSLASAWQRSPGVRLFDPRRELICTVLAARWLSEEGSPGAQALLHPLLEDPMWAPRACSSGARGFVRRFKVVPVGPLYSPLCAQSQEAMQHGLLWTAFLRPADPHGHILKLCLRCCFPEGSHVPLPAATELLPARPPVAVGGGCEGSAEGSCAQAWEAPKVPLLAAPSIRVRLWLHVVDPSQEVSLAVEAVPGVVAPSAVAAGSLGQRQRSTMAYSHARQRVEGLLSASVDLSTLRDRAGRRPLSWDALFGPAPPYIDHGAVYVTAAVRVLL